jgi:prepilin-type N-terminal cleavage/methylation domain-containing protein
MQNSRKNIRRQKGFTLIEAMLSMVILSFGILSVAAIYAQGMYLSSLTSYDYIAQKKAEQAVEAIFAARDTGVLSWATIQNQSTDPQGVFLDGPQRMLQPGNDGLVGTTTSAGAADELIITGPNAARQLGTSTDESVNLNPWMTRTITITPVTGEVNLRQITVTINYQVGKIARTYTLVSYISSFS